MSMAFDRKAHRLADIPLQDASLDIWDSKYRLKTKAGDPVDRDIEATYERVARALADVEPGDRREHWYQRFLWALRRGAIPAGRIISNAGAEAHKPATSTINCTVSGLIKDSMHDILEKVHEAGLTLKAGCVAPGTHVYTERGLVTADRAVAERHARIRCYDRDAKRFEMRPIVRHLTTRVPRAENIEIVSNGARLRTSVGHPVLVYRAGRLVYVRADDVRDSDALVHYRLEWTAAAERAAEARDAGARLADGAGARPAWPRARQRSAEDAGWGLRAKGLGGRLRASFRAAERELLERSAALFQALSGVRSDVVSGAAAAAIGTAPATTAAPAAVTGVAAEDERARDDAGPGLRGARGRNEPAVGDPHRVVGESGGEGVPEWIRAFPERHFLPFLAGLVEARGAIARDGGGVTLALRSPAVAADLERLLRLFGVQAAVRTRSEHRVRLAGQAGAEGGDAQSVADARLRGDACGSVAAPDAATLKISDSAFLAAVAVHMREGEKRDRIRRHTGQSGLHDAYALPAELEAALARKAETVGHKERQALGFYHGYHRKRTVSRVWLERWAARFPDLGGLVAFARTLRPVDAARRGLDLPETFYDFHVEGHNNYVAGCDGLVVIHNCGIGYEFSTLRPRGAYVSGAGAYTSGPLSFMDIYDKMCFTVSSAGGRRGAQMGTFDVGHPDVLEFIRAKREDGRLRQFNLSLLVTDEFMQAVEAGAPWQLAFPVTRREAEEDGLDLTDSERIVWRRWPAAGDYVLDAEGRAACRVYRTLPAQRLWDMIMSSTYDFAEPGFVLIDRVNELNNNWWCENIRATNPCGEQPLPEFGSCLLGSVNLTKFVVAPFTEQAYFDWDEFREVVKVFTRMLDNVVEINGLPLPEQRREITTKRRHGMGFLGLGSAITLLGMRYGSPESVQFAEDVARELAIAGWETGLELAKEKGAAPILLEEFDVTEAMLRARPEMREDGWTVGDRIAGRVLHSRYGRYMQRLAGAAPELVAELERHGARFTHHSSIAPTGTISLSLANNASNGIEPSFAHHYFRNVIRTGKKSKEKVPVFSFELLAYRQLVNPHAMPGSVEPGQQLPDCFVSSEEVTPSQHVDIQAAAQKWIDSSISKTANVPTEYPYQDFKDIYLYAHEKGLKGCTTFRFNPEAFQGVLVKEKDLKSTTYRFTLDDGTVVEARGDEEIEYDGEVHSAANLFDALKEGYYGKF